MSFVLTKGTDDKDATEFTYVARDYACVAIRDVKVHLSGHSLAPGKVIRHLEFTNSKLFPTLIQHAVESTSSESNIQWST